MGREQNRINDLHSEAFQYFRSSIGLGARVTSKEVWLQEVLCLWHCLGVPSTTLCHGLKSQTTNELAAVWFQDKTLCWYSGTKPSIIWEFRSFTSGALPPSWAAAQGLCTNNFHRQHVTSSHMHIFHWTVWCSWAWGERQSQVSLLLHAHCFHLSIFFHCFSVHPQRQSKRRACWALHGHTTGMAHVCYFQNTTSQSTKWQIR